jgi:hypothetical protein
MFLAVPLFGDIVMRVGIKGVARLLKTAGSVFHALGLQGRRRGALALLLLILPIASCTNIKFANRGPASKEFFPDQTALNKAAFALNQIVVDPNPNFAGSMYNMIGQNGEFGNYCSGNYGVCSCEYTYTLGTNVNQMIQTQVVYVEDNMLRCPNSVPSGAASFSVKIMTQAGQGGGPYESNSLSVNLGTGGTFESSAVYADLADEKSYVPVRRYQCRKLEFISSPFDSTFLDPIQSQDPRVIYPFNFYTTNVGESILALQRNGTSAGWDCTLTPTFDYSLQWWANPMVFSDAPCTTDFCLGDGELIYPVDSLESGKVPVQPLSLETGKRRSSFAVLPRPFGVFSVPIIAAAAPQNYVSAFYSGQAIDQTFTLRPLGYAAQPVVQPGGGSGCPNIPIPAKSRWVKLWNFRATDLQPPRRVRSTTATLNFPIGCLSSKPDDLFDSCYFFNAAPGGSQELANSDELTLTTLASRVIMMGGNSGGGGRDPSACYNLTPASPDIFEASMFAFSYGVSTQLTNVFKGYPFGLYSGISGLTGLSVTMPGGTNPTNLYQVNGARPQGNPVDVVGAADTVPLSNDLYSDHLFVVSDPSVTLADFQNLNSPVSKSYRPVTYRSRGACTGPTSRAGCNQDQVNWEVNVKNINQPTGPEVYPLCVLQFSD